MVFVYHYVLQDTFNIMDSVTPTVKKIKNGMAINVYVHSLIGQTIKDYVFLSALLDRKSKMGNV